MRPSREVYASQVILLLTVAVVIAFRTSARLGLAYGLAVNLDLLLTTFFATMVRWQAVNCF